MVLRFHLAQRVVLAEADPKVWWTALEAGDDGGGRRAVGRPEDVPEQHRYVVHADEAVADEAIVVARLHLPVGLRRGARVAALTVEGVCEHHAVKLRCVVHHRVRADRAEVEALELEV